MYSLIQRPPDIDDAWLGEHAYWQSVLGYVKSDLMHGITQQETRFLCHHKLLTLQGALFINAFGFSLNTINTVPLFYLLIFFPVFYLYCFKKNLSPKQIWFSILLLASNAFIFQYSFVFRPEIPLMTLGFLSYIFVEKTLVMTGQRLIYPIVSGIFAGLSIATHLNGIIFPVAGFLLLVINKRYLQGLLFGISAVPPALIYFYDFTEKYGLRFWLYQLNETPSHDRITNLPYGLQYLSNLVNEHMRFFHSQVEISFSILFIFSMILLFRYMKPYYNLILYTTLLVVFLALLSVHKSSKYIIIYLPYLILLISFSFKYLFETKNISSFLGGWLNIKKARLGFILLLFTYLSINIYQDIQTAFTKYKSDSDQMLIDSYIGKPTHDLKIIAPMHFFFNTIGRFKTVQSELSYSEMQKNIASIYQKGFLNLAASDGIDYIILSEQFVEKFGIDKMSADEVSENNFTILLRNQNIMILKSSVQHN
jgi:hypothetical protein